MPLKARLRSYSIALTIIVLAGLIGWVGQTTWQQLRQLRRSFPTVLLEGIC